MPPKAKGGAKKKGGYQMPQKFDEGFTLKDIFKTNWTLGKPIGQGGFGLIYLANKGEAKVTKPDDASFVVKIEPKDNGPLFCETHFYINCAKEDDLKGFARTKGLKHLAMPKYVSSGLCTYGTGEYRFLVMERYVRDLQSVLNEPHSAHRIGETAVLCLTRQVLYALEYMHSRGYAHGDIKGANLMLKSDHEAYLVDFGLAYRFKRDDIHQKYEIKPERRHNGTIEYTSRDAHAGAQVYRRSDLEILAYCAIHWLSGSLPWIGLITDPDKVQQSKIKNMNNPKEFVKQSMANCSEGAKSFVEYFLAEIGKLEFDTEPPYSRIQTKLSEALRSLGHTASQGENFSIFKSSSSHTASAAAAANGKTPKASNNKHHQLMPADAVLREFIGDNDAKTSRVATPTAARRKRVESEPDVNEPARDPDAVRTAKTPKKTIVASVAAAAAAASPAVVNTPSSASKRKPAAQKVNEDLINEISEINFASSATESARIRASKKTPSKYLQSTRIDHTLANDDDDEEDHQPQQQQQQQQQNVFKHETFKVRVEQAPLDPPQHEQQQQQQTPKTSRVTKTRVEINASPAPSARAALPNENEQPTAAAAAFGSASKYGLRSLTPTRAAAAAPTSCDQIGKLKQIQNVAPRSPLALTNLPDAKGKTLAANASATSGDSHSTANLVLVKKRRNVSSRTVETQTDESYLAKHSRSYHPKI